MAKIDEAIEINASPEKIWSMIQWDRIPEWMDVFKKVEWTSKEKYKAGSTLHIIGVAAGVKAEFDVENTEVTENEKVAWRTTAGNVTGGGVWALNPTKAGTKVTVAFDYKLPYSVLGKLIDNLRLRKALEKDYETGLKKLKDMMEK